MFVGHCRYDNLLSKSWTKEIKLNISLLQSPGSFLIKKKKKVFEKFAGRQQYLIHGIIYYRGEIEEGPSWHLKS
jgi:hypothetical protein